LYRVQWETKYGLICSVRRLPSAESGGDTCCTGRGNKTGTVPADGEEERGISFGSRKVTLQGESKK